MFLCQASASASIFFSSAMASLPMSFLATLPLSFSPAATAFLAMSSGIAISAAISAAFFFLVPANQRAIRNHCSACRGAVVPDRPLVGRHQEEEGCRDRGGDGNPRRHRQEGGRRRAEGER